MYAKIIRVKCSHSSKPLHGCEIFRKDARLLGAYDETFISQIIIFKKIIFLFNKLIFY